MSIGSGEKIANLLRLTSTSTYITCSATLLYRAPPPSTFEVITVAFVKQNVGFGFTLGDARDEVSGRSYLVFKRIKFLDDPDNLLRVCCFMKEYVPHR